MRLWAGRFPGPVTAARPTRAAVSGVLCLVLAACGGSSGGDHAVAGPSAARGPSAGPGTVVRGTVGPGTVGPGTVVRGTVGQGAGRPSPTAAAADSPAALLAAAEASGARPQTPAIPRTDRLFRARVATLWPAILSGRPGPALAFFFPLAAYRQVKALADPAADWNSRLVALYDLDLALLHRTVPAGSSLLGAVVPAAATWVAPGQEFNKLGYWRVYGTRVRYRRPDGDVASFGVCSMISWRGDWYAVHLGPVNHPAGVGARCP